MPELSVHEILQKQRSLKPDMENVIPEYLEGDTKKSSLDFIAHLRENKMKPVWTVANGWKSMCKGKPIYCTRLPSRENGGEDWCFRTKKPSDMTEWVHSWVIYPYLNHINEYEDIIIDKGWQDLIWDNMCYCQTCSNGCAPGVTKTIVGKELKGLCLCGTHSGCLRVLFVNPDETTITVLKKLLELERQARVGNSRK